MILTAPQRPCAATLADTNTLDDPASVIIDTTNPVPEEDDGDIDLPPLEDDDDGDGDHWCAWSFDECYDDATYRIATFVDTDTGLPYENWLCLRHFVMTLERVADTIGEVTSRTYSVASGERLADDVHEQILEWAHPADAPLPAVPVPCGDTGVHHYLVANLKPNDLRPEDDDSLPDTPENPIHVAWNMLIMEATERTIREYLADNGLRLVASPEIGDAKLSYGDAFDLHFDRYQHDIDRSRLAPDERDFAWVGRVYKKVFRPILRTSHHTDDALARIAQADLSCVQ